MNAVHSWVPELQLWRDNAQQVPLSIWGVETSSYRGDSSDLQLSAATDTKAYLRRERDDWTADIVVSVADY